MPPTTPTLEPKIISVAANASSEEIQRAIAWVEAQLPSESAGRQPVHMVLDMGGVTCLNASDIKSLTAVARKAALIPGVTLEVTLSAPANAALQTMGLRTIITGASAQPAIQA